MTWFTRLIERLFTVLLHTPGLQQLLGRRLALLTVDPVGGSPRTIPVTYARSDDNVLVLSKPQRRWWRAVEHHPIVQLRLAGHDVTGRATAGLAEEADLPDLSAYLSARPATAFGLGMAAAEDGPPDARPLLGDVILMKVRLPTGGRAGVGAMP